MRKLRAIINQTVDKKTKKVIKRLSDDLHSSRAELVLERLAKQKATEALRHEKKKRKRGRKLMEQFRAEEGSGAILFSPGKVRVISKSIPQLFEESYKVVIVGFFASPIIGSRVFPNPSV